MLTIFAGDEDDLDWSSVESDYFTSPDIPSWVWVTTSVVLTIIGSFGMTSNLMIIVTYLRHKSVNVYYLDWYVHELSLIHIQNNLFIIIANNTNCFIYNFKLHGEFNRLLMNMIFAELIMAFYGIPVDFITSVLRGWKLGKGMCNATGFLLTLSGNILCN